MEYSSEVTDDIEYLNNDLNWHISGHSQGSCSVTPLPSGVPFVTLWKTDNPGSSGDTEIIIPAHGQFQYTWEEVGNPLNTGSGTGNDETTIDFGSTGEYEVSIYPTGINPFHWIRFNYTGDKDKLLKISQWGDVEWISFEGAFYGASNLEITATDIPDLGSVNNMSFAFANTTFSTVPNINSWDVSNVDEMTGLFGYSSFNQDISNWDVSNVQYMNGIFYHAANFNQDIGGWNVQNVTDTYTMFLEASAFNQNLANWNLENLNHAEAMFLYSGLSCENYSLTLRGWADNPNTASNVDFRDQIGIEYSSEILAEIDHLINNLNWDISGHTQGNCSILPPLSGNPFITIWKTDNSGGSGNTKITIPTYGQFQYTWKEVGNPSNTGSGTGNDVTTIDFGSVGEFEVSIYPYGNTPFNSIDFNDSDDKEKILQISQWGDVEWSSFEGAFYGALNLEITAVDIPDLSNVMYMTAAFSSTNISTVPNMSNWDVSNVTHMNHLFSQAENFNEDISSWDVSQVTNMWSMFSGAESFNQDISNWDVSAVEDMSSMFKGAVSFNQDISNWDVSAVEEMYSMFEDASSFNQDISGWDVSNTVFMEYLFRGASSFNQNLANWELNSVIWADSMFEDSGMTCENYSHTLQGWANNPNTASFVTFGDQIGMEYSPEIIDDIEYLINDLNWSISGHSQGSCSVTPLPSGVPFITLWKTDNPGSSGDTEIIIPAHGQFQYSWEEVGNPSNTGSGTGNDVTTIDFGSVGEFEVSIYPYGNTPFNSIDFNDSDDKEKILQISQWGDVEWSSFEGAFYGALNLEITAVDIPDLSNVMYMTAAFSSTNISTVPNMSNWDVSNVTHMNHLFSQAENFNEDISSWDVSQVTNMWSMFSGAESFNQDISNWDVSAVEDMSSMFKGAVSFNQDISNWDVSAVEEMYSMFEDASS